MGDFFDSDGYPTEATLRKIREWEWKKGWCNLMTFVQAIWHWGDNQYSTESIKDALDRDVIEYTFHTGGWSGNEWIIGALSENRFFWFMNWYSSKRGGHYKFRVRLDEPKKCVEATPDVEQGEDN